MTICKKMAPAEVWTAALLEGKGRTVSPEGCTEPGLSKRNCLETLLTHAERVWPCKQPFQQLFSNRSSCWRSKEGNSRMLQSSTSTRADFGGRLV